MKNHILKLLILLLTSSISKATEIECMVKINGVSPGPQVVKLQPIEGKNTTIGVFYQDDRAQIVVTDQPFAITINETLGGLVIDSTRSSQLSPIVGFGLNEKSKTLMSNIKKTNYYISCKK